MRWNSEHLNVVGQGPVQESDCKVTACGSHVQRSMTRNDGNVVKVGSTILLWDKSGHAVHCWEGGKNCDASNACQAVQIRVAVSSGNGIQEG